MVMVHFIICSTTTKQAQLQIFDNTSVVLQFFLLFFKIADHQDTHFKTHTQIKKDLEPGETGDERMDEHMELFFSVSLSWNCGFSRASSGRQL